MSEAPLEEGDVGSVAPTTAAVVIMGRKEI